MDKNTARASEHPAHVWEAQRRHFTQLYKDKKRKLAEVQRIMQDEHGFYATERQYKRKIKKWGLEKNSKAIEKCHALVTLKSSDTSLDMACVYKLNGKDIAAHKLLRYARSRSFQTPNIIRNAVNRRGRATKARSQDIITSLAFAPNNRPGNKETVFVGLHELLASVICLMWFEQWDSLDSLPRARSTLSFPNVGFLKWTKTILMATQLTTNHVILATLYVYRLKSINPAVTGKEGSEYRLATIALMLANKFLDDYHYTNRTWAEVSGMLVQEVNSMEVEFLGNMRYFLTVQPRDWEFWFEQLGKLQGFLRQPLAETPRIIQLPDVPQSDQQTVPPGVPDTEMHNIHDTDIPDIPPSNALNIPDFETPDVPDPAMDDVSDHGMHANIHSETQRNTDSGMQGLPSNGFDSLEDVPTDASDGGPDIQTNDSSQDIENGTVMAIDTDAFGLMDTSFANMLPSPLFPSTLTMELPTPVLNPGDALLEWRSIDSSELQEGPIPDLDTFLDPSLWEDSSELSQLNWNSAPLLEQSDTAVVPPEQEQRSDHEIL